jgi:hypothetical protein
MFYDKLDLVGTLQRAIKYVIEGLAVALAAYYIPNMKMSMQEVGMIALTSAATFAVLDILAPSIGMNARSGAGLGIGAGLVGF